MLEDVKKYHLVTALVRTQLSGSSPNTLYEMNVIDEPVVDYIRGINYEEPIGDSIRSCSAVLINAIEISKAEYDSLNNCYDAGISL